MWALLWGEQYITRGEGGIHGFTEEKYDPEILGFETLNDASKYATMLRLADVWVVAKPDMVADWQDMCRKERAMRKELDRLIGDIAQLEHTLIIQHGAMWVMDNRGGR